MSVSATIPTIFEIKRRQLIGLLMCAAALAATVTWLLFAVVFDSAGASAPPLSSQSNPAMSAIMALAPGHWPGPPPYPRDYRGMP